MMACFNQLSGLNAINFYSSTIFKSVFTSANAITIGTSLTGIAQVIGVLIAPVVGLKFSLKTILVWGTGACTICMACVALFSSVIDSPNLVLVFILLFLVFFQASQGSFFFTYVAEVAEDAGVAWANFTLFTFILIFAVSTQKLFDTIHNGYTFMIFAICNLVATVLYSLVLKDISDMSKTEKKSLYASGSGARGSDSIRSFGKSDEIHGGDNAYIGAYNAKDVDESLDYH